MTDGSGDTFRRGDAARADPVETITDWCEFGDYRAYILMAIARATHNDDLTGADEVVHRRVLRDADDVRRQYDDLRALLTRHDLVFRIYLTVNARNTLDAYFEFRDEMNGWIRDLVAGDDHAAPKLGEIDSRWKSALHSPTVRDDQYFQFDVDDVTEAEIQTFTAALETQTTVASTRATPNGYHVLTEPFNYTEWEPPVAYDDLDTDGQVFVEEIDASRSE
ncbi:hypothetical protein [Halovivax cerinus]|uniref:Uncharacterized protein n=1 Tax=Halovivax cerinus TaxID=1487865 RepID=A0ABD5NKE2_9EURY|nr:hypothetical protein [Halovivax cerinus]